MSMAIRKSLNLKCNLNCTICPRITPLSAEDKWTQVSYRFILVLIITFGESTFIFGLVMSMQSFFFSEMIILEIGKFVPLCPKILHKVFHFVFCVWCVLD